MSPWPDLSKGNKQDKEVDRELKDTRHIYTAMDELSTQEKECNQKYLNLFMFRIHKWPKLQRKTN